MIPIHTTLTGIGPHDQLEIPWSSLPSPIAIQASYGTGKTWAVESIIFALYGRFAFYSNGSIYDQLTTGGNGIGEATLTFSHVGRLFRITRKIVNRGKTRNHTAMLEASTSIDPLPDFAWDTLIAGPKVADVDQAVEALVGPVRIALATWFLSQSHTGDLCGTPDAKDLVALRREIFARLIGADVLDAPYERFAEASRITAARAKNLEAILASEPDHTEAMEGERQTLALCGQDLAKAQAEVQSADRELEATKTKMRDAATGDDMLQAQVDRHNRATEALTAAEARRDVLEHQAKDLQRRADGLLQAKADLAAEDSLKARRKELSIQQRAWEEYKLWSQTNHELQVQADAVAMVIHNLEKSAPATNEDRALADCLEEYRQEFRDAQNNNESISRNNRDLEQKTDDLNRRITTARVQIDTATTRLKERPVTPGGEICETCPLISEYTDLPGMIDALNASLASLKAEKADIPAAQTLHDLSEIKSRGQQAAAAAKLVEKANEQKEREAQEGAKYSQLVTNLEKHGQNKPESVHNPICEIESVQQSLDTLAGAAERLASAERACNDLEKTNVEITAAQNTVLQSQKEVAASFDAAQSAHAILDDHDKQNAALKDQIQSQNTHLFNLRASVTTHTAAKVRAETNIEHLKSRQLEQATKRQESIDLRSELSHLEWLRNCYGPRGVRQVLLDNAVGALEDIADDLFQRATGGGMRLRIATQAVNLDGSTKEAFDILVTDGTGERDVLNYSGGEQQLIRILFRISVALWQSQRVGHKAECIFLDEAFDNLGADGTDDLFRVLDHLGDTIPLIVTITHDPAIAARHRSVIRMQKRSSGVLVQFQGAAAAA